MSFGLKKTTILAASLALSMVMLMMLASVAQATRIKDIATFKGVRSNQLVGYGLVVGLSGTGDKRGADFTTEAMANMLDKMGVQVSRKALKPKNVAAVMVTADMPVSARPGTRLDVTVSSIGDAQSLLGGILLMTPLKGIDGNIYALSQGALTLGGFRAEGAAASATKNVVTVGIIPGGGTVERAIPFKFNNQESMTLNLSLADFSTTMQVVDSINGAMGGAFARALDASTVELEIPNQYRGNLVPLMASIENLEVRPDGKAKVVVDEKTGTVVLGRDVRLNRVAVAHGNLQIVVAEYEDVSQPEAFSNGETVVTEETEIGVKEENKRLHLMEGATLQELVDGLNSIGATPRDLISILRTLKSAGALYADLEVI